MGQHRDGSGEQARGPSRRSVLGTVAGTTAAMVTAGCPAVLSGPAGSGTARGDRITLEYVDVRGDRTAETFDPVLEALNERHEPTIDLEFTSIPYANMKRQLLTRTGGNDPPDVAAIDQVWLGSFIDSDRVLGLDEVADRVDFEDYLAAFRSPVREAGHVYGIPVTTDVRGLYWNKQVFEDAGLDPETPPRTYEDLFDVAEVVHDPPTRYGSVYMAVGGRWTVSLFGAGGRVLNEAGTEPRFQEAPGREAARFLDDLYNSQEVTPPEPPYQNGAQVAREFLQGQHAMTVVEGSWLDYFWKNLGNDGAAMEEQFGFAPTPSPDGTPATMSGGFTWVGFEGTDHPDVVRDFLAIAGGREFKRHLAVETGSIPTRESLLDDDAIWEPMMYSDTVKTLLGSTRTRPIRNWPAVANALDPALQRVAFDRVDPETALEDAATAVRAALSTD